MTVLKLGTLEAGETLLKVFDNSVRRRVEPFFVVLTLVIRRASHYSGNSKKIGQKDTD